MTANMTDSRPGEAAIERDVRRTQDEIGETVDKLEEKLNPRDIARSAVGDEGVDVAREAFEVTKQNPFPVALIAVGLIWLLATSRSPILRRVTDRVTGKRSAGSGASPELRPRSAEPAPIGPPGTRSDIFDRRPETAGA